MTPAGWYADHTDPSLLRYWDGDAWTSQTKPADEPETLDLKAGLVRVGDRVVVPTSSVIAGLAPERCVTHDLPGDSTQLTFTSKTPEWAYLTLIIGLIWPFVIAAIVRKSVAAPAWPVCQKCRDERGRNLVWMCVSIGSWLPVLVVGASLSATASGATTAVVFFFVLLAPLGAALWFRERAIIGRGVGGEVSADGQSVSFPARVFPVTLTTSSVKRLPPDDPAAYFGG